MINLFKHEETAITFVDKVIEKYKRYARDQFMVLEKSIQNYPEEQEMALNYCIEKEFWSANDFRDVAAYFNKHKIVEIPKGIEIDSAHDSSGIQVSTRSIREYVKILGGEMNE